jgi:hypothetical protein
MTVTRITRIRRSVADPGRLLVEAEFGSVWRMVGTVYREGSEWFALPGYFCGHCGTCRRREPLGPFALRREAMAASMSEPADDQRAAA